MLSPSSHLLLNVCGPPLAELSPRQTNAIFLIPITIFVCIIAAALTFSALRRLRIQHARADELAGNLQRIRDETRRRLLFLNAISHDLRTPLNGIALQTHIIERAMAAKDDAALELAAKDIRESSTLAAEILDALLQYAHTDIDQPVIAPVNLSELVERTSNPFRAAAEEKSLVFSQNLPPTLIVRTDAAKFQRILANLLDNAVKFTNKGSIAIRAKITQPPIALARTRPPDYLLIEVQDTGCGILAEHQERLFREFFQANNPSRDARLGLGLGLVIARRLTEKLGGSLECQSVPREGSTFQLQLPLAPPALAESA